MARRRITIKDVAGLPGFRSAARAALLERQPRTVAEALKIPDVGRMVTKHLLALKLITDPDGVQEGRRRG